MGRVPPSTRLGGVASGLGTRPGPADTPPELMENLAALLSAHDDRSKEPEKSSDRYSDVTNALPLPPPECEGLFFFFFSKDFVPKMKKSTKSGPRAGTRERVVGGAKCLRLQRAYCLLNCPDMYWI